jgi:hypothetical protein
MLHRLFLSTALAVAATSATAQLGADDENGLAQNEGVGRGMEIDTRGITGTLGELVVGECTTRTRGVVEGAHLIVTTMGDQQAVIHLGPTSASVVEEIVAAAEPQQEYEGLIIRTDEMPFDAFAAATVTLNGQSWQLRDDEMRPVWAAADGTQGGGEQGSRADGQPPRCWFDLSIQDQ